MMAGNVLYATGRGFGASGRVVVPLRLKGAYEGWRRAAEPRIATTHPCQARPPPTYPYIYRVVVVGGGDASTPHCPVKSFFNFCNAMGGEKSNNQGLIVKENGSYCFGNK